MVGQIVEIANSGYKLKKSRGFLQVSSRDGNASLIALDDIACILVSASGCTVSTVLIDHLCQRNIPLVMCGENYVPSSITMPLQGYGRQFEVMRSQVALSEPRRKRAWQHIVRSKIGNQASVLELVGAENQQLKYLIRKIKSGDSANCEAQAARIYWKRLFGSNFRRERDQAGINAAINYAYSIVRSCIVRGLCGSGLHPSFSIHHRNPQNPLNLADDMIEPFRPIADYVLWHFSDHIGNELTKDLKLRLASIVNLNVPLLHSKDHAEISPLSIAATKVCKSFAHYCEGRTDILLMPELPGPLDVQAM